MTAVDSTSLSYKINSLYLCFFSNYVVHYVAFVEVRGLLQSLEFILSTHMLLTRIEAKLKLAIFIGVWILKLSF